MSIRALLYRADRFRGLDEQPMSNVGWVFLVLAVVLGIAIAISKDGNSDDGGWR